MAQGEWNIDRRTLIKGASIGSVGGVVGLAGCSGNGGNGENNDGGNGDNDESGNGDAPQDSYSWSLGTSGQETGTHAVGVAMASMVSENSDILEVSAQTTGGTVTNIRLVDQGDIDMGLTSTTLLWMANNGVTPYVDPPLDATMTQLFSYFTANIFVMKKDTENLSGVETVSDLPEGTSISLGPRGTSTWDSIRYGLELLGIEYQEKFDVKPISYSDQPAAMREGRIDAAVGYTINDLVLGWLQELDSSVEFSILDWGISEDDAEQFEVPLALNQNMSADLFNQDVGVEDTFTAITQGYSPTLPATTSEEAAYEFVSIIMDNHEEVSEAHAALGNLTPEFATEWLMREGVPVHPGAERYFKENDLWNDNFVTVDEYEG